MPRRRPHSPLSLETSSPQAADLDTDDLIASDDELDDASRTSRRHRIEKLAEAYRNGTPLFILSASLRGPFDQGWVNPWRKDRKRKANRECESGFHREAEGSESRVVQETDPRRRRHPPRYAASPIASSEADTAPSVPLRSSILPEGRGRSPRSSPSRIKRRTPGTKESQTRDRSRICIQNNDDWLKRNHNYPRLTDTDPLSSPTNSLARRLDDRPRKRSIESLSKRRHISQRSSAANQKQDALPPASNSSVTPRFEFSADNGTPHSTSRSHDGHRGLLTTVPGAINPETSLCTVSSSSHLLNFEDRRPKKHSSRKRRPKSSSILSANEANPNLSTHTEDINATRSSERNSPTEGDKVAEQHHAGRSVETTSLVGDSETSNGVHGLCPMNGQTGHSTAEETGDRFPSAQQMPNGPSVTDCEPSLHSTSVPKGNLDHWGTDPGEQLSTQAAFLLAQKSFQNDLNTLRRTRTMASERKLCRSQSPSRNHSHQGSVTPFFRLNTPNPDSNEPDGDSADGLDMMSTQHMVDAITPFALSTEKSNKRTGTSAKSMPSSKIRKKASFAISPSSSVSSSHGNKMLSDHRSTEVGTNLCNVRHQYTDHQAESQLSALPFTLTGSTPPTAQDGQGAEPAASFNLSQAIAEAGSWLRQSFDLNMEMKEFNKTGPSSSTGTRYSAMNLDITR